jgi:hypothetical protein
LDEDGNPMPPPPIMQNINNDSNNNSDLKNDMDIEIEAMFSPLLGCQSWTKCINNTKTRRCYYPEEDKYTFETKECYPHCYDHKFNFDETDIDCGGSCGPCLDGKKCKGDNDCINLCNDVCFSLKRSDIYKNQSNSLKKNSTQDSYNYLWFALLIPILILSLFWFHRSFVNHESENKDSINKDEILLLIKEVELFISENRLSEAKEKYKIITENFKLLSDENKKDIEPRIEDLYYELLPGFTDFYF